MIVTLSKTSIKTRAAHMPAKLPPITRALVAGMDHSRRGPQIWRRRCASCRCNIGGCLVTPSHELRPSGRAVYETALARYVGADDRSKTALNGVGPEVFPCHKDWTRPWRLKCESDGPERPIGKTGLAEEQRRLKLMRRSPHFRIARKAPISGAGDL